MSQPDEARLGHVRGVAERVAAGYGLDIFDVQLRREGRGWTLRIIIDRPGPAASDEPSSDPVSGESVSIEDCRRVSEDVSAILDVEDTIEHAYVLEVSSPGLDRPLRHADDYRRFRGRLAKIVTKHPLGGSLPDEHERPGAAGGTRGGQTHFAGRITGVEEDCVLLEEGRRIHRVPLAEISRARLEVEFAKK